MPDTEHDTSSEISLLSRIGEKLAALKDTLARGLGMKDDAHSGFDTIPAGEELCRVIGSDGVEEYVPRSWFADKEPLMQEAVKAAESAGDISISVDVTSVGEDRNRPLMADRLRAPQSSLEHMLH
jgi:hypothetical protein